MDSAKYLATIDSLCTGDLSAEHAGSTLYLAGPGYRIVSLEVSHGLRTGDAAERVDRVEDFHALKDDISDELNARWGEQHPRWAMLTLTVRIARGEQIPEPWARMSLVVDELNLWQPDGTDRWIALGVADKDEADEVHLLVVASDIDPA